MGKIKYQIIPKHHLIIETYWGEIFLKEYQIMKQEQFIDPEFKSSFNVIADFRKAVFDSDATMESLLDFFKQNKNQFDTRKSALVVSTPIETSKAYVFSHQINSLAPINANVFSTISGAFSWLGIFDETLIEEID